MGAFTRTENEAVVGLASRSACEQGNIVCTCTHHSDLRQAVPPTLTSAFSHPAMKPGACRQQSMCCSVLVSTVSEGLTLKGPSTVWFWLRLRKRSLKNTRPTVG